MKERPILFSAPMVRALIDGSDLLTIRVYGIEHYQSVLLAQVQVVAGSFYSGGTTAAQKKGADQ